MDLLRSQGRVKRGLFNPIGSVHKFLWGSLSASDGDYYNSEIDKLYNHTNQLSLLVSNETVILKKTLELTQDHFNAIDKNFERLNNWAFNISDASYDNKNNVKEL